MKYDHKFTCPIFPLHRNKGRNGLYFGHFEGRKNSLYHNYKMNIMEGKHNIRPQPFRERDRGSYNISCCLCDIKELIFIV
jgi:hypothetical protein